MALALLITGNRRNAKGVFRKARELMTNWVIPFAPPEQITKWVKWVTMKAAVADSLDEIRYYEARYLNRTCMHAEHLLQGNLKLQQCHDFLLHLDPAIVIAEVDPYLGLTSRRHPERPAKNLSKSHDRCDPLRCRWKKSIPMF